MDPAKVDMPSPDHRNLDNRNRDRYLVHWKIGLIFDEAEHRPTYLGRTYHLSLSGTGMLMNTNVFSSLPVVILLAPPPLYRGHRQKIIEIKARQVYCVYSGEKSCFDLGFEFNHFKDDGARVIMERLKFHRPLRTNELIRQITLARASSA